MICPHCRANLETRSASGDTLLRGRGLVMGRDGLTMICPKCRGDVPVPPETMQALHRIAVLFFQKP